MTVLEMAIASAVLLLALGVFLGSLESNQRTEQFTRKRNEALDDLRLVANAFAREARQATAVTLDEASRVVLSTAGGPVTYEVVTSAAGVLNLRRVAGTANRVFVVRLTDPAVFAYNGAATPPPPGDVRLIRLRVATRLDQRYPPVAVSTEVAMRNA